MKRLIIDCDPGNGIAGANVDDGLALALAIASAHFTLELITIVAGNTPANIGYRVARNMMNRVGVNIPVRKGEEMALQEPAQPWREALDQRVHQLNLTYLWDDINDPPLVEPDETGGLHFCNLTLIYLVFFFNFLFRVEF